MKLYQALIALFFSAVLLSGCNNAEESAPATDAAPAAEPAAPAADAAAPAAEPAAPAAEPAQEEPGGWVPPAEGS